MSKESSPRQVTFYPNFAYFKMFIAYCHIKKVSKSKGAIKIIESFFKDMYSDHQRVNLIAHYESMKPEDRWRPGKVGD